MNVNRANSATEPDTSQSTTTSGRCGCRRRSTGSIGIPPDCSERRIVRRMSTRPVAARPPAPPDAGGQLAGERLQRPAQVAQLGGAERERAAVGGAQRRSAPSSPSERRPVAEAGDLVGEGPAERLEGAGDLVAAQRQLELGALPSSRSRPIAAESMVGDVERAQDAVGDGAVGRLVVAEHRHRPRRQRPHRRDVAGRRGREHGDAESVGRPRPWTRRARRLDESAGSGGDRGEDRGRRPGRTRRGPVSCLISTARRPMRTISRSATSSTDRARPASTTSPVDTSTPARRSAPARSTSRSITGAAPSTSPPRGAYRRASGAP